MGLGFKRNSFVEYDTNYSLATLIRSSRTMNPSPSMIALIQASESNPGLYMSDVDVARYEADGTVKWTKYSEDTRKFPVNRNHRILYDLAELCLWLRISNTLMILWYSEVDNETNIFMFSMVISLPRITVARSSHITV